LTASPSSAGARRAEHRRGAGTHPRFGGGSFHDVKGSLEPGKLADLVVWTEDPYTLKPKDLVQATVDLTMVGGIVVYERT